MHKSAVGVLLIFVVLGVVGCAAYDKAKDLNLTVRTDPEDFTLTVSNSGFEANNVCSDDWEEHADDIKSVKKVEVSYEYDNQSAAPVTVSVYISDNPNLTAENVAASAKLLYQTTLPADTESTTGREEVGDAEARELLKQYNGNFTVYTLAESDGTVDVTMSQFRVYGTVNADFT